MKKVAIFLNKDRIEISSKYSIHIIIFEVIGNAIKSMDNEFLAKKDINYISLWLLNENIEEIYVEDMDEHIAQYLEDIGIVAKTHEEMRNNTLFGTLLAKAT